MLKVGVYFDLRVPAGVGLDPSRVYAHTLEMSEEAEHLGADSIWVSEHHLFDDGYLPQPLVMLAAIAARTRRVRLGTALIVAPLHDPVEIAEQAAVVDLISDGRVEIGLGPGYRMPEYELYGAQPDHRYGATDGTAARLRRLWGDGGVTPAPVQARIPIWLGYNGPQGARRAGLLGEGLLALNPEQLPGYRAALAEGGFEPSSAKVSGPVFAYASEDPERDWPIVSPYIAYQQDSYRRHWAQGLDVPPPRAFDPERARSRSMHEPGYFWFGTPEEIAARTLEGIDGLPVDTLFLWGSIGGMAPDLTASTVQTVCTRLAPLLRAGAPAMEPAT